MNIEKIEIALENCESCTFKKNDILNFELIEFKNSVIKQKTSEAFHKQRVKTKVKLLLRKTPEALRMRKDVSQIHVFYSNGMKEAYYLSWGDDDDLMNFSSLQDLKINQDSVFWSTGYIK